MLYKSFSQFLEHLFPSFDFMLPSSFFGFLAFQLPNNHQNCAFLSVLSQLADTPAEYSLGRFRRNLAYFACLNAPEFKVIVVNLHNISFLIVVNLHNISFLTDFFFYAVFLFLDRSCC